MPELPEVETVKRGLETVLAGRRIRHLAVRRKDLRLPFPSRFAARMSGRRVEGLGRRAKFILINLDGGETLVVHLGMSGRVTVHRPVQTGTTGGVPREDVVDRGGGGPHDHVVFETEDGTRVVYTDHRRFGLMALTETAALSGHPLFARLGPEPLDAAFTPTVLAAALRGKQTPIKSALLDQRVVAGLGNIYVCEALHRAGISPRRLAGRLPRGAIERLTGEIKSVLLEAIDAGGSSLRDYANADGELGYFQHRFKVYDRAGLPCTKAGCAGTVQRIVQAGRSTFFCRICQR